MGGTLGLVLAALAAGRPPREVALRLAVAIVAGAAAWAAMCAFVVLEPGSAPEGARRLHAARVALRGVPTAEPASFGLLEPLNRPFGREGHRHA